MDLKEFDALSIEKQLQYVEEKGVLIGDREDSVHDMFLYQAPAFYIELAYNKDDGNLWRIAPFDHPLFLEPYLSKIDINEILR